MIAAAEWLAGIIVKWLVGWLEGRATARKLTQAQDNQAAASVDAAKTTDKANAEIEHARETTDAAVTAVHADAANPDRVRDDIQSAIDRANASGDVQ